MEANADEAMALAGLSLATKLLGAAFEVLVFAGTGWVTG